MRLLLLSLLVVIAALMQFLQLKIFGVVPGFALTALIVAVFFAAGIWEGIFLSVLAGLVLKFSPSISGEIIFLISAGILTAIFYKFLPWNRFINGLFLIFLFTLAFYSVLAAPLMLSSVFAKELAYNLVLGVVLISILLKYKNIFRQKSML